MYDLPSCWKDYFGKIEPEERLRLLDELLSKSEYNTDYALARILFDRRYEKKKDIYADNFLFYCIEFTNVLRKPINLFKNRDKRRMVTSVNTMGMDSVTDELSHAIVYMEMRNALKRYFAVSLESSMRRKYMGIMALNDDENTARLIEDAWNMSEGIAKKLDIEKELKIWNAAVLDAFFSSFEGAKEKYERYANEKRLK